mmetsp:Transcript_26623/g.64116  ORF Transcript_26623/g.64116 Transcript_26623/m.64116 type:complete len:94 (+) Transcript_26623:724-1005(+)
MHDSSRYYSMRTDGDCDLAAEAMYYVIYLRSDFFNHRRYLVGIAEESQCRGMLCVAFVFHQALMGPALGLPSGKQLWWYTAQLDNRVAVAASL